MYIFYSNTSQIHILYDIAKVASNCDSCGLHIDNITSKRPAYLYVQKLQIYIILPRKYVGKCMVFIHQHNQGGHEYRKVY